jgi:ankyrin repeat protein
MRLITLVAAAILTQISSAAAPAAEEGKKMSPVLRALMSPQGEAFVPPAHNEALQALLRQNPKLDFFEMCGVGDVRQVRAALQVEPALARSWHSIGWSALHFAAFSGDAETVTLLLDRGAAIDARAHTRFLNTPLQAALLSGQISTARVLIERGADVLMRQQGGFAPIHEAALLGRRDLVDVLLAAGAEINARANDGRTPVSEALRGGHPELADYLRSHGGKDATIVADLTKSPD